MTSSKYEFNAHHVFRRTIPFTKEELKKKKVPPFLWHAIMKYILFYEMIDEYTKRGGIALCVLS